MKEFLQAMAGLGLIRLVMDMALPEGESRQYADLFVGLMMMTVMLRWLYAWLGRPG